MKSLVLTLDPHTQGGVIAMQRAMMASHERLGLSPWYGYGSVDRKQRFRLPARELTVRDHPAVAVGLLPSLEFLNYVVPAMFMRKRLAEFPIVQLVSGSHSAAMVPILARHPFVSWVATPYGDEIESRRRAPDAGLGVRVNHALRPVNDRIERWTFRFPGKTFALSHYTARRLADETGLPLDHFDVLHMPADPAAFPHEGPRWERAPRRYVVTMSRVDDERKNVASLVRCFARVAAKHEDVSLVVVGLLQPDSKVVALTRELGIGDRVAFPGVLSGAELAAAYRSADAYVMTSRQEGLGIVVQEAQATARASLIMRCGGSDELIDEGRTGWLIDQGDEDAFAAKLDEILGDEALRVRVGRAAREELLRTSSLDAFDRALAAAYARVFDWQAQEAGRRPRSA